MGINIYMFFGFLLDGVVVLRAGIWMWKQRNIEIQDSSYWRQCMKLDDNVQTYVCYSFENDNFCTGEAAFAENFTALLIVKKCTADSYRVMFDMAGEHSLSLKTCEYWFQWFKRKYFDVCHKQRCRPPQKIADAELEVLFDGYAF